jgi:hypothetical protein
MNIEQIRRPRVILDATKQTTTKQTTKHRSDEHAARRTRFDDAGAGASSDARLKRRRAFGGTKGQTNENGRRPCREGENHAAQFAAQAAAGAKGMMRRATSVPGVVFPIQFAKVGQPMHRQTVLVLFTLDV